MYCAGGVAGDDVAAHVQSHQAAHVGGGGYIHVGPAARDDGSASRVGDQAAYRAGADHAAGGPDGVHVALSPANQRTGILPAGDIHIEQPNSTNHAGGAGISEQAKALVIITAASPVDEQVADGVALAVESGGVWTPVAHLGIEESDRVPAGAAVPVGITRVGVAAAVSVKVQVGGQLIAVAAGAGSGVCADEEGVFVVGNVA